MRLFFWFNSYFFNVFILTYLEILVILPILGYDQTHNAYVDFEKERGFTK